MIEVSASKEFLNELMLATQLVLQKYKLGNSNLLQSIEYKYERDHFVLLANDYFTFVSTGRRPRARKIPVEDLIKWMKRKGITPKVGQTYNSVAYSISESVYKTGIKGKNYINPVIDVTTEMISDNISDVLSEEIATVIANDLTFSI